MYIVSVQIVQTRIFILGCSLGHNVYAKMNLKNLIPLAGQANEEKVSGRTFSEHKCPAIAVRPYRGRSFFSTVEPILRVQSEKNVLSRHR